MGHRDSTVGNISIGRYNISVHHGSEGPSHDPYSYVEYDVTDKKTKKIIILHLGLAEWLKVDGKTIAEFGNSESVFENMTKLSPDKIDQAIEDKQSKCSKCGSTETETKSGYPGETFVTCANCGEHLDTHMNWSAIE